MASAASNKILRVALAQGGKITEERQLKRSEPVTVGQDAKNTFVVPVSNLPASFEVFANKGGQYALVFTDQMDGKVFDGKTDVEFSTLRIEKRAQKHGDRWVFPLSDVNKGRVSLGEVTLLFQFIKPPPEAPREALPELVRGSFLAGMDRLFLTVLAASMALHFSGATCIWFTPKPVERELTLDELPDRFAKVLIPQKIEEPKPTEVVEAGTEAKDDAKEQKDPGPKKEAKTAAQEKAEIQKKVASKGLLKILGSAGSGGGALEDVLGSSTGMSDISTALAGAGGVGVATADAIAAGGPKGGGTGEVAGIGDLGTSGGGNVNLGTKSDAKISGRVRDATPEVDSSDVDRDALARYVKARLKAIQSCYEKELKRNPSLKGKVVVRFTITPGGRASDVDIDENTLGNEAVGACIRTYIRGWVFPFKPEAEVTVSYPFVFAPAS